MPNSRASDTERDATEQPPDGSAAPRDAGGEQPEGAATPSQPGEEQPERAATPSQPGEEQPEGAAAEAPVPDLSAELAQAEDRYKRALADLDNYRKRSARDLQRRVDDSTDGLLRDWLEALDSVERALRMQTQEPSMFEGLRAVLAQMEAILERQGVQRIGAAGERFDPERHEAVGVRHAAELPDRTVVEVPRSGFARGDRVLRPAQVIVSDARGRND